MDSITLITNASAGSSDQAALAEAVKVLEAAAPVAVVSADDRAGTERLLADLSGSLVIAGGDGSLHAIIGTLHRNGRLGHVLIGLVPLGTGNDFARGVGFPLDDPAAASRVFLEGVRREVDVIRDESGGVVVNAVHLGVGADAGREAQPWKAKLGKVGYLLGAVVAGVRTPGYRVRVVADAEVLADGRRRLLQVAVGNGAFVGGGTPLIPDADPHDGSLDVLVSFAVAPLERLRYAVRLRRGSHGRSETVVTTRAREVSVAGVGLWLNADGELEGPVTERRWTVEPRAFAMMLPTSPARHPQT
ncbi:MAG: diacylglycerol kinase family protein [Nocardioidaceae bacterium]